MNNKKSEPVIGRSGAKGKGVGNPHLEIEKGGKDNW